jgi:hypothetical protein
MGVRPWVAAKWHAYRRLPVLDHCASIVIRLVLTALRLPVWLAIALLVLPHFAAVLVTAAFELLLQYLLRLDDRLAGEWLDALERKLSQMRSRT